jgi:putative DNA primase/helicase
VFKNGVLDLTTFEFKDHSPNFLETIQLNVNFNPNARSKIVDDFFATATSENAELETLLYEAIGYSLLKTVELASCFILTGSGRNGKSTYLDLIKGIVGKDNATSVDFKELGKNFGVGGLANKLVSLAGDISNQRINDSDMFKKIVSGDMIRVDEKYEKKRDKRDCACPDDDSVAAIHWFNALVHIAASIGAESLFKRARVAAGSVHFDSLEWRVRC